MANKIKNLKERIEPREDVSTPLKSNNGETKISRSSKRKKRRRELSKLRKSLSKVNGKNKVSLSPRLKMQENIRRIKGQNNQKVSNHSWTKSEMRGR